MIRINAPTRSKKDFLGTSMNTDLMDLPPALLSLGL
jgi:hypothetical protein